MKNITSLALAGALVTAVASGAVTDPVGYSTQTISNGVSNLVGLTLHGSTASTGAVTGVAGAVVTTDDGVVDGLGAGPFVFEITSGSLAGAVNLITSLDSGADTITLENDLSSGLSATDTFVIRESATIASVFGTGGDVVIGKGDANTGDLIYVPAGAGAFDVYYHSPDDPFFGPGDWTKVGGSAGAGGTPLVYDSAIFVQNRSGADYDLTVTGEVKTTDSIAGVIDNFNYLSSVYPVGVTLDDSGIADSAGFQKGDANTGDIVFISNSASPGAFRTFYHTPDDPFFGPGQWTEVGGGAAGSVELSSGVIIQKRAAAPYNAGIGVPSTWTL